jgi:hypothetical protein
MVDTTDDPKSLDGPYSYDVEPLACNGAQYVRCELCKREVVPADPDILTHHPACPESDG